MAPQPDNLLGNENCLAVLNIYVDGVTWHDIPCDQRKHVICERPRAPGGV